MRTVAGGRMTPEAGGVTCPRPPFHRARRQPIPPPLAATAGAKTFEKGGNAVDAAAAEGGDSQDQNLLQFFLDVVEFGMSVQEAAEAPNFNSFQMRSSFGAHESRPGLILLNEATPPAVRAQLERMGYEPTFEARTSGPITAIMIDTEHGTMWGAASNYGDDYGIGW